MATASPALAQDEEDVEEEAPAELTTEEKQQLRQLLNSRHTPTAGH